MPTPEILAYQLVRLCCHLLLCLHMQGKNALDIDNTVTRAIVKVVHQGATDARAYRVRGTLPPHATANLGLGQVLLLFHLCLQSPYPCAPWDINMLLLFLLSSCRLFANSGCFKNANQKAGNMSLLARRVCGLQATTGARY